MLSQPLAVQSVNMNFHKAVGKGSPPPSPSLKDFRSREGTTFPQGHTANLWCSWALLPTRPYSRALAFSLLCVAFWFWFCSSLVVWFWFTMSLGNFGDLRKNNYNKTLLFNRENYFRVLDQISHKALISILALYSLASLFVRSPRSLGFVAAVVSCCLSHSLFAQHKWVCISIYMVIRFHCALAIR